MLTEVECILSIPLEDFVPLILDARTLFTLLSRISMSLALSLPHTLLQAILRIL